MSRSKDITNLTEYRQNLRDYISHVCESGRPLYVTTNGKTNAVMLSPEAYDALADRAELAESLLRIEAGMEEVRTGKTRPAKEALREIAKELGIELDR